MSTISLTPQYFGTIDYWILAIQSKSVLWPIQAPYKRQTYRNRMCIQAANQVLTLTVPVCKPEKEEASFEQIRIAYNEKWHNNHWRSIKSAYGKSPFFAFLADDLEAIFHTKPVFLLDLLLQTHAFVGKYLKMPHLSRPLLLDDAQYPNEIWDCSALLTTQKAHLPQAAYAQTFASSFVPNLSVLDVLFHLGANAQTYLKNCAIHSPLASLAAQIVVDKKKA